MAGSWENKAGVSGLSGSHPSQKGNYRFPFSYNDWFLFLCCFSFNNTRITSLKHNAVVITEKVVLLLSSNENNYVLFTFQFTFAKIWLLYGQFEIRQKNLQGARKVMVRFNHRDQRKKRPWNKDGNNIYPNIISENYII